MALEQRKMRERVLTGTMSNEEREYEIRHRAVARAAAAEGFVLLKNENSILPMKKGSKVALYGSGAVKTIKGGTGSGDVNERSVVSIYDGMKNAGFVITTEDWIQSYEEEYSSTREVWKKKVFEQIRGMKPNDAFKVMGDNPFRIPAGAPAEKTDADTAVYVLSRVAGEGADRFKDKGDYYLSDREEELLAQICGLYEHVVVLVNTGGMVDCSFVDTYSNIDGVLLISQPGMEAGNSVADVLCGDVNPSGKLTDSWAMRYEDYPNQENYSHNNGNVEKEIYNEGIYVGYRYFDTFEVPVRYAFGYGLSYTDFTWNVDGLEKKGNRNPLFEVTVSVTNTGKCAGREVIQVYAACPQEKLKKEYRRLVGFAKTGKLEPGQTQTLTIGFSVSELASYNEADAQWQMEAGCYGIYVGNSLMGSALCGSVNAETDIVISKLKNICPVLEPFTEMKPATGNGRYEAMKQAAAGLRTVSVSADEVETEVVDYDKPDCLEDSEVMDFVKELTTEQLIKLATGNPGRFQTSTIGAAGISVPGSAAETSPCAKEQGVASIVLADGPAGLRLTKKYYVKDGKPVVIPMEKMFEVRFLHDGDMKMDGDCYHQFCTAIPVGTLLAQSWDMELIEKAGKAIAEEMKLFCVTLWLAPGMNIHRNPLCGRNFEYYSEDPLVSGVCAAAMTKGVQSMPGCGTTIKHFACNNQEDNRMGSDSILSERALREIYLKGFEIAVKTSQPLSIMTSYNLINGIHAANNYDICTNVARKEWGFKGTIMTDWTTTMNGPSCTASGCVRAGNDLVMPGAPSDHEDIGKALEDGTLTLEELQLCIARTVNVIWQSDWYED